MPILAVLAVVCAASASASSLTLIVRHEIVMTEGPQKRLVRVVFTDERLTADLQLSDGLRALSGETWLRAVRWSLVTNDGRAVALPAPVVRNKRMSERGPTYDARLEFGSLPPGEYVLAAELRGLHSEFPFIVATGQEPGFRDRYLWLRAREAGSGGHYVIRQRTTGVLIRNFSREP